MKNLWLIPQRKDAVIATLAAGFSLATFETVHAYAQRWEHAREYFGLSFGLTLALSLAVGIVAAIVSHGPVLALALWTVAVAFLCQSWQAAVPLGLAALALAGVARTPSGRPLVLGVLTGCSLALALISGDGVALRLGLGSDVLANAFGTTLLFAPLVGGVALFLAGVSPRVGTFPRAVVVLGAALAFAARPLLEAPDQLHRLPPPGYEHSQPKVADSAAPNVFLFVLDTVRADHLSLYGYERETSPQLDRWVQARQNSVVYTQAYANGTWTVPSHASLFTGRLPNEHGAHFALDGSVRYAFAVEDTLPTLAETLTARGYATLGTFSNHWLRTVRGIDRGFERWFISPHREALPLVGEELRARFLPGLYWEAVKGGARAEDVSAALLSMVAPWSQGPNPLFAFANFGDAHGPYAPPAGFRGRFVPSDEKEAPGRLSLALPRERRDVLEARYDEEICSLDHELGLLLDELDRHGLLERSWVFVTADHGEAFGEHGVLEHGTTVHDEVVRIPLVVFPPTGERLEPEAGPVSLVDVAATIAAIAGAELGGPGRDLRKPAPIDAHAAIEFYGDAAKVALHGAEAARPARAVVLGRHKLIDWGGEVALYEVANDVGENVNLASAMPDLVEHLRRYLPPFGEPVRLSVAEAPPPDVLERLRELGYTEEAGPVAPAFGAGGP